MFFIILRMILCISASSSPVVYFSSVDLHYLKYDLRKNEPKNLDIFSLFDYYRQFGFFNCCTEYLAKKLDKK